MSYSVFGPPGAPLGADPEPPLPSPTGGLFVVGGLVVAVGLYLWWTDKKPASQRKPRRPSRVAARRAARRLEGYIGNAQYYARTTFPFAKQKKATRAMIGRRAKWRRAKRRKG